MSCWIRKRPNKTGVTFQVLFRRGGRGYPIETAGSFRTQREAKLRRDLVAGWLAQMLDPKTEMAKLQQPRPAARLYADVAAAYLRSRVDYGDYTRTTVETQIRKLIPLFGHRDPAAISPADCMDAVASLSETLAPSSLRKAWQTHRLILDYAGVDPNPARDRSVRLPRVVQLEVVPPPSDHAAAILERVVPRYRLALTVIEQTAMTPGEIHALEWGDVDTAGLKFRLRRATVKAQIRSRARWVQVPEWLMVHVDLTCPLEDRIPERRVFPGAGPAVLRRVMGRACAAAGVPHYSPYDLRHRRISLWHGQGVPARELAARAGHSKASMSLDVYSHVMPLDEIPVAAFQEMFR